MAKDVIAEEENRLLQFFACLNTSLTSSDLAKVTELLTTQKVHVNSNELLASVISQRKLLKDGAIPEKSRFKLIIAAAKVGRIGEIRILISKLNPLAFRWNAISQIDKERDLYLAAFDHDMSQLKAWLKIYQKEHYLKPEEIVRKLFGRYISLDLLQLLPWQLSIILGRSQVKENLFNNCGFEDSLNWILKSPEVSNEDKAVLFYLTGENCDFESPGARAINHWQKKDYREVCRTLDRMERLILRRKVQPGKINQLLVVIHVLSRIQVADSSSAVQLFKIYQSFFEDSMVMRVIDILLDLNHGSLKKANKKLASLSYQHRGSSGDTFFLLLCRYWCENQLSVKDLSTLKKLVETYSDSANLFMRNEVNIFYKEVVGAGTLLEQESFYTHLSLARYMKGENKWDELLESLKEEAPCEKRIIWLMHLQSGSETTEAWCEIEPAIQEKGKLNWKAPEFISWLDMMKPSNRILLSSQDRRVLSILRKAKDTHGVDYRLPESEALKLLSGAANLYFLDEPKQQIRVEYINPSVEVVEINKQQTFSWKYPLTHGALHIEEIEDYIFEVCVLSAELHKLKEKTMQPMPVGDDQESFEKFLKALPEELLVHGEVNLHREGDTRVQTDYKLQARFLPSGDEYRIHLLVECNEITAIPGMGRSVLSIKRSNNVIVWQRDKHQEGLLADRICESSGLDLDDCLSPYEWEILDKTELLQILDSLSRNPQIELHWPRGGKVKMSKAVSGNFTIKAAGKKDWFQLDGKVCFDKQSIRLADVLKKLTDDKRFVKISDNEYLALTSELQEGLQSIARLTEQKHDCLELHAALSDTLSEKLKDLPCDVEEDFIFRDCVTRMIYAKSQEICVPDDLNANLRSYQKIGFEWLYRLTSKGVGAYLADDMGLGKTIQTLTLLLARKDQGPSLIVAPTSLCYNWINEAKVFTPSLNLIDYRGKNRQELLTSLSDGDVLVCSYALIHQDIDLLMSIYLNIMILDEAQMVKNSGTLRSKSIKLLQAKSRIALSGTPVENHVGELWNMFDILNPGLLGSRAYFQKNYALPIEQYIPEAMETLKGKVQPFILRRTRKNVLKELPDSQESNIYVSMTAAERSLYDASRYQASKKLKRSFNKKEQSKDRIQILAEITRLRKLAANFELSEAFKEQSSKSKAVLDKIQELLENGHKALIFSQFVTHLNIFENYFKEQGLSYTRLDGSMSHEHRQQAVELFNGGQRDLMLISLKAGGFGLNLTTADFIIHLDPWWNPAVEDQASGRALRIGQTKKVNIVRFITEDSIEDEILKLHEHKREISDDILRGTSTASKLSVKDLMKLITQ
jgi:superfamily II DNA or RNA helicase